jgi:uncharacterized protein (TIGR02145 family)
MRKCTFLFLLIFALAKLQAQDYLISFAGTGAATAVDSVLVENLTQRTSLTVGSGNQLHLLGTMASVAPGYGNTENPLVVYPNPSVGEVVVTFDATTSAKTIIGVTDMAGRQVSMEAVSLTKGRQSFLINGLNSATYLVQIRAEGYHYNGKIFSRSSSGNPAQIIHIGQSSGQQNKECLKQSDAIVVMQYTTGDLLKFTGRSGIYGTVYMDVPTTSKTISFNFMPCTDSDDNNYTIVQIGDQWWMAENLKTTKYSNGDSIPEVKGASDWMGLSMGAYCYFGNEPDYAIIYGCLYNWQAVIDNRNPCPANWHVPSDAEWIVISSFLGGEAVAGGKMKETGTVHWFSPNAGATNESGFTIVAGGNRSYGNFDMMGYGGSFWSTTPFDDIFAWNRDIFYYTTAANRHGTDKKSGLSVRCVKN